MNECVNATNAKPNHFLSTMQNNSFFCTNVQKRITRRMSIEWTKKKKKKISRRLTEIIKIAVLFVCECWRAVLSFLLYSSKMFHSFAVLSFVWFCCLLNSILAEQEQKKSQRIEHQMSLKLPQTNCIDKLIENSKLCRKKEKKSRKCFRLKWFRSSSVVTVFATVYSSSSVVVLVSG